MCNCINVDIGTYDNQITLNPLPEHMREYKEKAGGHPDSICVDACLAAEIQHLWSLGITTTGCCCGHNKRPGFIGVIDSDIAKMKDLGYQVAFNACRPDDEDSLIPKSPD